MVGGREMKFNIKKIVLWLVLIMIVSLVIGGIIFSSTGGKFLWIGFSISALNYNAKIEDLDVGSDRIYFLREPVFDENSEITYNFKIYSIKLDGTDEKYEYIANSTEWEPKSNKDTMHESMGSIMGKLISPDKKSQIIIEEDIKGNRLWLEKEGERTKIAQSIRLFSSLNITEIKWLKNSKGLIIVGNGNKIGIYEINTGKYAYLTEGQIVVTDI